MILEKVKKPGNMNAFIYSGRKKKSIVAQLSRQKSKIFIMN